MATPPATTEQVDSIVIGAGVVGLAVARALARAGREVIVLEAADAIGTGVSGRNSEVIHAGIYYPPGSLKAALCVAGRRALYDFAREHGIEARPVGKLLVATQADQVAKLRDLLDNALRCGVGDLIRLDGAAVRAMEPAVDAVAGLFSPSSGIVDGHGFMLALQGELEAAGGMIAFNTPVRGGQHDARGLVIETGGADPVRLRARLIVNAAGLSAPQLAGRLTGAARQQPARLAKGSYFALSGMAPPFRHLVYPMPEPGGLGIHATIDLAGQVRFGPDVEWVETIDYTVDPDRATRFYPAIRRYWPGLPDGALHPAYAGIRPKLVGPGEADADFLIEGPDSHGVAGLWNLLGIESPGLTAALALAELIAARCLHP